MLGMAIAVGSTTVYLTHRPRTAELSFTQLTDFTDSAMAPALSPDGRMVAFIRGSQSFLTEDQIYVKMLPNGESVRLTDDRRPKYNAAFSPDGSQVAYTVIDPAWATYTVSVLGGEPRLFLNNAAGLTWLDRGHVLFSTVRSGLHMGIATATVTGEKVREIYFPPHERAMAHYSYASPDRKSALIVEMDGNGAWTRCRLISLNGDAPFRPIGPEGACTSAGWSPDGRWMYFTAWVNQQSHLWRQPFPDGQPQQITNGPNAEEGVAVERDGRSVITSMGGHESAIWIHNGGSDRQLSSEGEIVAHFPSPCLSADGMLLYYLLRRPSVGSGPELWRTNVKSGKSERLFPGIAMDAYDISPDGKQAIYSTQTPDGKSSLWLAATDRSSPTRRFAQSGENSPYFGPRDQILFRAPEGHF